MRPKSRTMHKPLLIAVVCALLGAWLLFYQPALAQRTQSGAPVTGVIINRSTVNASVVIASGGTFQQVLPSIVGNSDAVRQSLTIQNNNASHACWIYLGSGTATEGTSISLPAAAFYVRHWPYVPSDEIQATCASTSDTLYVDTQ